MYSDLGILTIFGKFLRNAKIFRKIEKIPQSVIKFNPRAVNIDNLLFYKSEGDMGSIVYFHPKQKYVFKFSNKETRLKEEYLRYKEIYDKNLPIPKLIGFLNIESGVSNMPNKALVTEYGGEPIYYKLNKGLYFGKDQPIYY